MPIASALIVFAQESLVSLDHHPQQQVLRGNNVFIFFGLRTTKRDASP